MTESWPVSYDDVISRDNFSVRDPEYREGIYVGYRYYDKAGKAVRYPFGHGLSYTQFEYSDLRVEGREVTVTVKNTGARDGAEVVQLYVAPKTSGIFRPEREICGFEKLALAAGESREVSFVLDDRSFAVWSNGWKIPEGEYVIEVGSSSRDIRLCESIFVSGEEVKSDCPDTWYHTLRGTPTREEWEKLMGHSVPVSREPKRGEFTMDNSCLEMKKYSLMMKIQFLVTKSIISKGIDGKKDMSNPTYKMMITSAVDCPMRSAVINSGGMMSESLARGMVLMANGKPIKGIAAMMKK